jgi:hypothetical protein
MAVCFLNDENLNLVPKKLTCQIDPNLNLSFDWLAPATDGKLKFNWQNKLL